MHPLCPGQVSVYANIDDWIYTQVDPMRLMARHPALPGVSIAYATNAPVPIRNRRGATHVLLNMRMQVARVEVEQHGVVCVSASDTLASKYLPDPLSIEGAKRIISHMRPAYWPHFSTAATTSESRTSDVWCASDLPWDVRPCTPEEAVWIGHPVAPTYTRKGTMARPHVFRAIATHPDLPPSMPYLAIESFHRFLIPTEGGTAADAPSLQPYTIYGMVHATEFAQGIWTQTQSWIPLAQGVAPMVPRTPLVSMRQVLTAQFGAGSQADRMSLLALARLYGMRTNPSAQGDVPIFFGSKPRWKTVAPYEDDPYRAIPELEVNFSRRGPSRSNACVLPRNFPLTAPTPAAESDLEDAAWYQASAPLMWGTQNWGWANLTTHVDVPPCTTAHARAQLEFDVQTILTQCNRGSWLDVLNTIV